MTRKKLCAALLMLLVVLLLASCGIEKKTPSSGDKGGKSKKKATYAAYEAGHSTDALLAYAKQLEKAGNDEAAKAVYALIDKTAAADGIYNGQKSAYDASLLDEADELLALAGKLGEQ